MKNILIKILFFVLPFSSSVFGQEAEKASEVPVSKPAPATPLFMLSGGMVYSSIDLSRYINSQVYRGYHTRLVTHVKGMLFISAEYSTFKVHDSPSAWRNIYTRKFDLNAHVSFATNNNLTRIFALGGINKHEWHGTRTGFTDQSQLGWGIPEGQVVNVNRLGVNFGCGFTQALYENIGLFGDYRFCFGNARSFEKVRIMDVMTTFGVYLSFAHPAKGKKNYGIGGKIYKWTKKGAKK